MNNDQRANAKAALQKKWSEAEDDINNLTAESLDEQISGYLDMSLEDFDGEMEGITGWQRPLNDEQADEWLALVNESAIEWLVRFELNRLGLEENEEGIEALTEALAEATSFETIQKGIADQAHR